MSNATDPKMNPWHPITEPVDLKHLGKLLEELNECGSAVARCLIQGLDGAEPVTGKVNRTWLEEEIADVRANCDLVEEHFKLTQLVLRESRKRRQLKEWHRMA